MKETVPVANYRTKVAADLAAALLEAAGIPYVIQSSEGMLHGPINPGATILVPPDLEADAREILETAEHTEDDDAA